MQNRMKVVFLGGVEEIGKNMTVLVYNDSAIIIDVGIGFPDSEIMPGVEYLIPDMSYLEEIKDKIKGIVLTHGHEDHMGALSHLPSWLSVPIYGSNISLAFSDNKRKIKKGESLLNVVEDGKVIDIGDFRVEFIRVTHSIAGAFSLAITTKVGTLFFTGDFKIDHSPVDGKTANLARIAAIGAKGVLALFQESTNIEKPGYSMSESKVGESLELVFNENKNQRIIVATFSSNIHRIRQIIECAIQQKRKILLSGMGIQKSVEIARKFGQIAYNEENFVDIGNVKNIPHDRLCIIATGTQGEVSSALTRMSQDGFWGIKINEKDTIVFSANPIPGNEKAIHRVMNDLSKKGAKLIYEDLSEVHASGHAHQEELKLMIALIKPKFFIPVHGEFRHLKRHAQLAESIGIPKSNIYVPELGSVFELSKRGINASKKVKAGGLMVSASGVESQTTELKERKIMSEFGVITITMVIPKHNEGQFLISINSKGFHLPSKIEDEVKVTLYTSFSEEEYNKMGVETIENMLVKLTSRIFFSTLKKCPLIIPEVLYV